MSMHGFEKGTSVGWGRAYPLPASNELCNYALLLELVESTRIGSLTLNRKFKDISLSRAIQKIKSKLDGAA